MLLILFHVDNNFLSTFYYITICGSVISKLGHDYKGDLWRQWKEVVSLLFYVQFEIMKVCLFFLGEK
jgi:hypothetical protein